MSLALVVFALGLLSIGCGDGIPVAPEIPEPAAVLGAPQGPIVVNVLAEGQVDSPDLRSALALIEGHFRGQLRFVRDGSGSRSMSFRIDPAAMYSPEEGATSAAWAQPAACRCTAEGEIVFGSLATATNRAIVLHEIGHLFGLLHRGDGLGLLGGRPMSAYDQPGTVRSEEVYSEGEWALIAAALAADSDAAGRQ